MQVTLGRITGVLFEPRFWPVTGTFPSTPLTGSYCDLNGLFVAAVLTKQFRHIRSEEHTSELQSRFDLVCRLLLEKKNILFMLIINHLIWFIYLVFRMLA